MIIQLYALQNRHEPKNVCFRLGRSVREVWEAVVEEELFGTGKTRLQIQMEGWVARPVMLVMGDEV